MRMADLSLRFNRTFMELKVFHQQRHNLADVLFQSHLYGIEREVLGLAPTLDASFNRTFMELKEQRSKTSDFLRLVSIAPLWN